MYRNSKGKQQVQRLRSAVVNLPTFLSWFSFMDTNEFATETKQSLSNLSLCVFKIERWLKRICNIFDRSHVLISLAVEKDLSPSCCTCCRIDVNQLANNNDVVDQMSLYWLQILHLHQKCPERSVKWLAAWALKSYFNLFVLMFCSFCFVFPSVSFIFMFYGFLKEFKAWVKRVFWT